MIFSYYQNINQVYTRQSPEQDILVIKDKIKKETESVSLPKSQQCQNLKDRFNWIKKKYAEFSELNKFSPVKASSSLNFINQETSKFFMKSKKIINPEQTQNNTNGQEKKKRFFSESEVFEQKKRKSQNNKLFNSTLIDGEHNFVGKNYQKQVDIIKLSSNQLRTLSPKRIYLSKKEKVQEKQKTSSYQFGQNDTDKFHLVKCQINSLRKRLSLNEKSFQQRSSQQKQARCHKLSTSLCIADEIKKQHKKSVENHIKAEIKMLRKEKLNKFRLKDCHFKKQSKPSPSSKTVYSGKSKYQSPLRVSAMNSSLAEMLNSKISDKMKMKIEHYESIICPDKRTTRPIFEFNISDELKPWESQNMEFMELK